MLFRSRLAPQSHEGCVDEQGCDTRGNELERDYEYGEKSLRKFGFRIVALLWTNAQCCIGISCVLKVAQFANGAEDQRFPFVVPEGCFVVDSFAVLVMWGFIDYSIRSGLFLVCDGGTGLRPVVAQAQACVMFRNRL